MEGEAVEAGPPLPERIARELYLADLGLAWGEFPELMLQVRDALAVALEAANVLQAAVDNRYETQDRRVAYEPPSTGSSTAAHS